MAKTTTVNRLPKYLSLIVATIIVLMPFHAFLTVWLASATGHYTLVRLWKEFLLAILSLGTIYLLVTDEKLLRGFFGRRLVQAIILYIVLISAWTLVPYLRHDVSRKAAAYGWLINLRFLFFFLSTLVIATKSQWLAKIWPKLLLIPAAGVVLIGLVQRLLLPYDVLKHFGYSQNTIFPYETINHNTHYPRTMSTLRGANPLGAYLILIMSMLSALLLKIKHYRWQLEVLAVAAFIVLVLTYSRAAWIGLIAAWLQLIALSLRSEWLKRLFVLSLVVLVAVGGLAAAALRHNTTVQNIIFHSQKNSAVATSSDQGHASAFHQGIHDVIHQPLGRGVGSAGPASVYNKAPARIAENYFIQVGQEAGWLGLALFLVIYGLLARELYRRRTDALSVILLASLAGLTVVNFFSHAWADDTLAYIYWGLAGIAIARPSQNT